MLNFQLNNKNKELRGALLVIFWKGLIKPYSSGKWTLRSKDFAYTLYFQTKELAFADLST